MESQNSVQSSENEYLETMRNLLERNQIAEDRIRALELENEKLRDQLFRSSSQSSEVFSEPLEIIDASVDYRVVYCQNVNCMASDDKIIRIRRKLSGRSYAIVMLTETNWKEPNVYINGKILFLNEYKVFTSNRSVKQAGGGVLVAINSKYSNCEQLVVDCVGVGFDQVWTKVQLDNDQIHIFAVVYFYNRSKKKQYEQFFDCAEQILRNYSSEVKVHIYGDFNKSKMKFEQSSSNKCHLTPITNNTDSTVAFVYNRIHQLGLHQVNHITNQRQRFLDLVLTNNRENIYIQKAPNPLHENEVDHTAIEYFVGI